MSKEKEFDTETVKTEVTGENEATLTSAAIEPEIKAIIDKVIEPEENKSEVEDTPSAPLVKDQEVLNNEEDSAPVSFNITDEEEVIKKDELNQEVLKPDEVEGLGLGSAVISE